MFILPQLVGWATFGSFLILKGALLNALFAEPAGYGYGYARGWGEGGSLTEELGLGAGGGEYTVPYLEEWTVSHTKLDRLTLDVWSNVILMQPRLHGSILSAVFPDQGGMNHG